MMPAKPASTVDVSVTKTAPRPVTRALMALAQNNLGINVKGQCNRRLGVDGDVALLLGCHCHAHLEPPTTYHVGDGAVSRVIAIVGGSIPGRFASRRCTATAGGEEYARGIAGHPEDRTPGVGLAI